METFREPTTKYYKINNNKIIKKSIGALLVPHFLINLNKGPTVGLFKTKQL